MTRIFRCPLLVVFILFPATVCVAQVKTGTPPFGSFAGGPDIINLANLNSHHTVPVRYKFGRGMDFTYDLSYDSSVWYPVGVSGSQTWQPVTNWGWRGQTEVATGYITYTRLQTRCIVDVFPRQTDYGNRYQNWVYHDSFGVSHSFGNIILDDGVCPSNYPFSATAIATDGSGYKITALADPSATMFSSSGDVINAPLQSASGSGVATDRNGNRVSVSNAGVFTDTLGTTALTVSGAAPNPVTFSYTPPAGGTASVTITYAPKSVKTNFSCTGVAEYGPTDVSLVDRITFPDGSFYQFSYEATPGGAAGQVTGRLASVSLPTGGTIQYQYTGANNGIVCADGSAAGFTRTTPDGQWTYVRTIGTGAASTTIVTDPQGDTTELHFQGIYETYRRVNRGSGGTALPMQTTTICYNGNTSNCDSTAIALPITQRSLTMQLPSGLQSRHIDFWDTYGNATRVDEYDYGYGASLPLLRKTLITYAALGNNINAFRATVTVQDGLGNTVAQTRFNYDETAVTATAGTPQHVAVSGSRANLTSTNSWVQGTIGTPGAIYLTKILTYFDTGKVRTVRDASGAQTTFTYGACGNSFLTLISLPLSLSKSYAWDCSGGLLASVTDDNNQVTSYTYDPMWRPTTVTRADGKQMTYGYTSGPTQVTVTTPLQGSNVVQKITHYDGLGRPVKTTTADATQSTVSITEVQYDSLGRPYKASKPHNSTAQYWTTLQFDAMGRITQKTLSDASTVTYTYADNALTVTDPSGKPRQLFNDSLGRLIRVYEPDPSNNNLLTLQTTYTYTALGALARVDQGSQTRTYNYDGLGRTTSSTTPETGTVSYQYNETAMTRQRTDARGVITTYSYDLQDRITQISYNVGATGVPATPTVSFTYGINATQFNRGRLLTTTDGLGSETHSYDQLGNITQVQKVISGTTFTTGYQYDLSGQLTQVVYPSGRVVQQSYDALGRLCAVAAQTTGCGTFTSPYASNYIYNPAGQVTGFTYGNGVAASLVHSPDRLQLTSLSYTKGAQTFLSLAYGRTQGGGNNGQITSVTDNTGTQEAGRSVTYAYDGLGRLSSAVTTGSTSYPSWGMSWTYDRYGNRIAQTQTAGNPPANFLSFADIPNGGARTNRPDGYQHDASGNMLYDGDNTLTYDGENRPVSASNPHSGAIAFGYDGNGLRVRKCMPNCTSPTSRTVYIFSGNKVIAEYDNGAAAGSPTREYIYSGSELIATIDGSGARYHHSDHLSVRVTTDINGNKMGEQGHYPYGEAWYASNSTTKWLFTSYERDTETGLDYAMARYYISRFGRFACADPAGIAVARLDDPQSLNLYSYVRNDPVNATDPSGLGFWSFLKKLFRALFGWLFRSKGLNFPKVPPPITAPTFPRPGDGFFWLKALPGHEDSLRYARTAPFFPTGTVQWNPVNWDLEWACDAMAFHANDLARDHTDPRGFAKEFGNSVVGVGRDYGTNINHYMRYVLGNTNYQPIMFGVGPHVNQVNPDLDLLNYPGAFQAKFRDSEFINQDATHHFATFLEIAVLISPQTADNLALSIDIDSNHGQPNWGDIELGWKAAELGGRLREGSLQVSQVGSWIRENLCNPPKRQE